MQELGFADLKIVASIQEDDISVTRDNDRHNLVMFCFNSRP